jgi:hypothetical protein
MIELFERMGRMIQNGGRDTADIRRYNKSNSKDSSQPGLLKGPQ